MAETTIYLATSAKSNSAYMAINKALTQVGATRQTVVPLHLRNAQNKLIEERRLRQGYKYAHDFGAFRRLRFFARASPAREFCEPRQSATEAKLANASARCGKKSIKAGLSPPGNQYFQEAINKKMRYIRHHLGHSRNI